MLFLAPVLAPLFTFTVANAMRQAGYLALVYVAKEAIEYVLDSDGFKAAISRLVSGAIADAGVPGLVFSDVFDPAAVKSEAVAFAASFVGDKIGADFSAVDWETVEKDEILLILSDVVRERINDETGAELGELWPVAAARESIGAEILRQFEDGSAVGVLPQSAIQAVEAKIMDRFPQYAGIKPESVSQLRENVMNRVRQKRWRKKNKQVWVTR